jgi:4-diphosphocytidyl-2C-methyl-D-erythritol kinase
MEEKFEDTKGVITRHKSKKDRQHIGQKKKDHKTNNDLQDITKKTKDRVTRTPSKNRDELRCSGRISSSCSTCDTRRLIAKRHEHHQIWKSCRIPVNIN